MTQWTFEEVRALGERGDRAERALATLVRQLSRTGTHEDVRGAFNRALEVLSQSKLAEVKEALEEVAVAVTGRRP